MNWLALNRIQKGMRHYVKKVMRCVFPVIAFSSFSAFADIQLGDTVPPIVGEWYYYAWRCNPNNLGTMSSESAMAEAAARYYYGPTGTVVGINKDWGTPEDPTYGDCGSDKLHPDGFFDYLKGIETRNAKHYKTKYTYNSDEYFDGLTLYRERTVACPKGSFDYGNLCIVGVTAYLPKDNPPPQSCSNPSAGNPIVISDGSKFERTENIYVGGNGALDFYFTYNNANASATSPWRHNFQKNIKVTDPYTASTVRASSSTYTSKQAACTSGWNEIKVKVQDPWVASATVQMNGDSCEIVSNGKVINHLLFFMPMVTYPGSVQISRDDGSQVSFEYFGGEDFRSVGGDQGQLKRISAGGWQFSPSPGVIELYDVKGQLTSITRNGQKQQLSYNPTSGVLEKVEDLAGHSLTFAYTNNQLTNVTQENGKTTIYHYNPLGLIDKITHPDTTLRQYHYEDLNFPNALSGITDERGTRYATWKYDAQGRAISSEHANGTEKTQLSFNLDGSTTVTNSLNKNTIYFFDYLAGARRVVRVEGQPTTNCVGANQNYTYTPEGWRESKTDWAGNKTVYAYNTKGQETSRTEAYGTPEARTITTEWHPTLGVQTKVTEPGKGTNYLYEANGLLLNQTVRPFP